jgi:hypothetical protein
VRDPAGEFDDFQAAGHLAPGVGQGLAVLVGDRCRDVLQIAVQKFPEGEHDPRPGDQRGLPPGVRGLGRGLDRRVDVGGVGVGDLGLNLPGGGLEHRAAPARAPRRLRTADPVADLAHRQRSFRSFVL